MWQQEVGYTTLYDAVFSAGGPIKRLRYEFVEGSTYYCIWLWKGDYWNLGAGAEIGIYATDNSDYAEKNFYEIDPDLTLHVRMVLKYKELGLFTITLNDFHQTNWWTCSFTPLIQHPNINWLSVDIDARFVDNRNPKGSPFSQNPGPMRSSYINYHKLMKPFYNAWKEKEESPITTDDWEEITMLDYANKVKPTGHASHPQCTKHPARCECVCPFNNSRCANPCSYYTTKCSYGDSGCTHYGDNDNGFQFNIKY